MRSKQRTNTTITNNLGQLSWTQERHSHQHQMQERLRITHDQHDRQDADVFRGSLTGSSSHSAAASHNHDDADHDARTPRRHPSIQEGQASDARGVTAEMIKHSSRRVKQHLLRLYNNVMSPNENPFQNWRDSTTKVIYKTEIRHPHQATDSSL